ncbi:unnamed protein product [Pleuronectes platessa]|uniref:Uncharacterized protein n=1 Tax=Pleuronectes platessa TaxID=8262 RepID=A0A9N7YU97_PLEPL|nr:unnamed protein product [Pleuronectes platessa]
MWASYSRPLCHIARRKPQQVCMRTKQRPIHGTISHLQSQKSPIAAEPTDCSRAKRYLPDWLLAFAAGRRENDPVVRQTVLRRERERERERKGDRQRKERWREKVCSGTSHPQRPKVCNDWLQACREGGGERLTCSGVSSIAAETQPLITQT